MQKSIQARDSIRSSTWDRCEDEDRRPSCYVFWIRLGLFCDEEWILISIWRPDEWNLQVRNLGDTSEWQAGLRVFLPECWRKRKWLGVYIVNLLESLFGWRDFVCWLWALKQLDGRGSLCNRLWLEEHLHGFYIAHNATQCRILRGDTV